MELQFLKIHSIMRPADDGARASLSLLASACVVLGRRRPHDLRRPLSEIKVVQPWGTIFGHVRALAAVHADRLEQTDRRGFLHLRTKYWPTASTRVGCRH